MDNPPGLHRWSRNDDVDSFALRHQPGQLLVKHAAPGRMDSAALRAVPLLYGVTNARILEDDGGGPFEDAVEDLVAGLVVEVSDQNR